MKHLLTLLFLVALIVAPAAAQDTHWTTIKPGSDNMSVEGHIPLGAPLNTMDMEVEQELSRPYAYVARGTVGSGSVRGTDIISIADPSNPKVLFAGEWKIQTCTRVWVAWISNTSNMAAGTM